MASGVYKIINIINNKVYIGSSINLKNRKIHHFYKLGKNEHCNNFLQKSYNKYGKSNFLYEIIELCDESNVINREQFYIDLYKSYIPMNGYNILQKAGSCLGVKRSQETKNKQSLIAKSRPPISDETRKKLSDSHKGFKRKQESIDKTASANRGKKRREGTGAKISAAKKSKKISEKMKNMLRVMNLGKKNSEESKIKVSNSLRGKKRTEEQKKRMSDAQKGRKITESGKLRISNSMKGRYARGKHKMAKKIINVDTNIIYDCITDAAVDFNVHRKTISRWIYEKTENKPNFNFI